MTVLQIIIVALLVFTAFKLVGLFALSKAMKPSQAEVEAAKNRSQEEINKLNEEYDQKQDGKLF
ncbi:hypothetical protein [Streptococcus saliviloxodontae]|uniref:Uncharacterized protein n=1 Tax=Streptococcus saliviloxodontae TaxID=1349416 RepID=A0ABS2PMN7_9STRE|nr:hypothetical protein [Streptococcus saliviloxodontae]MBM7636693.1 hypothetical protein [Streptococcus saliviloxodontae]